MFFLLSLISLPEGKTDGSRTTKQIKVKKKKNLKTPMSRRKQKSSQECKVS